MKTIDLNAILNESIRKWEANIEPFNDNSSIDDAYINAMREAVNQAIDMCAENARVERVYPDLHPSYEIIDKQSILQTKNQIK